MDSFLLSTPPPSQLDQLHTMGITYSDAECLHALEAAQGDLQTALEILMGPGN